MNIIKMRVEAYKNHACVGDPKDQPTAATKNCQDNPIRIKI